MKTEQGSEPDHTVYTPEQTALGNKFCAVLSSYLRGRCTQLVRANQQHKDGSKLWFQMRREFLPATRQRSLAIAQTLGQRPNFNNKISMLENTLQYEQLVNQYEQTSKETYPSDLKTAALIRCAPQKLREHLQLSLSARSTYADVREALVAYERTSKSQISTEQILKQFEIQDPGRASADNGLALVKVDRVQDKGKSKGKYKGMQKGKGSWWQGAWPLGGRGRSYKGRGKGKQRTQQRKEREQGQRQER